VWQKWRLPPKDREGKVPVDDPSDSVTSQLGVAAATDSVGARPGFDDPQGSVAWGRDWQQLVVAPGERIELSREEFASHVPVCCGSTCTAR
jgi:hypothetical protein